MKRCPQCHRVFDDALVYCTNDGTPLVNDAAPLVNDAAPLVNETFAAPPETSPSDDEEITVIHHDPITIDIPAAQNPIAPPPTAQFNYQTPPPEIVEIVVEKPRSSGKNILFLLIGLLLGGALVIIAAALGIFLYQSRKAPNTANTNRTAPVNAAPSVKPSPSATPVVASAKHEKRTDAPDDDFDGRVISLNAYVRVAPNRSSKQTDVLPVDDRLKIDERENENSPWFHVTCEHGTSGWMHGNTIEYSR